MLSLGSWREAMRDVELRGGCPAAWDGADRHG